MFTFEFEFVFVFVFVLLPLFELFAELVLVPRFVFPPEFVFRVFMLLPVLPAEFMSLAFIREFLLLAALLLPDIFMLLMLPLRFVFDILPAAPPFLTVVRSERAICRCCWSAGR